MQEFRFNSPKKHNHYHRKYYLLLNARRRPKCKRITLTIKYKCIAFKDNVRRLAYDIF